MNLRKDYYSYHREESERTKKKKKKKKRMWGKWRLDDEGEK